jgi:predicted DNA-binding transcriptional regulator YafY
MPRAERLMELADLVRGRGATTVAALASELGVSRRTLLRDLGTLRERGMPITGEAGRGGGIRLDDRGVSTVHFSLTEIVAIWLGARLSRATSDLPWGDAANSGMAKLLACLPASKARALRTLCRRVIVGQPASANVRAGAGAAPRELLSLFEETFSQGLGLGFQYTDQAGRRSTRRIEPHGLLVEPPVWYILARDVDKAEPRMFRMDRVARPRILPDIVFHPDMRIIEAQLCDEAQLRDQAPLRDNARWRPLTGTWSA